MGFGGGPGNSALEIRINRKYLCETTGDDPFAASGPPITLDRLLPWVRFLHESVHIEDKMSGACEPTEDEVGSNVLGNGHAETAWTRHYTEANAFQLDAIYLIVIWKLLPPSRRPDKAVVRKHLRSEMTRIESSIRRLKVWRDRSSAATRSVIEEMIDAAELYYLIIEVGLVAGLPC